MKISDALSFIKKNKKYYLHISVDLLIFFCHRLLQFVVEIVYRLQQFTYVWNKSSHMYGTKVHICMEQKFTYVWNKSSHKFTYVWNKSSHMYGTKVHICMEQKFTYVWNTNICLKIFYRVVIF